jgi:hypothetical protein
MQQYLLLIIPILVSLTLAAWHSGAIQRVVNKQALRLPQWAQPLPPILLASLATVAEAVANGTEPSAERATLVSFATIGVYHAVKRWGGTWLVNAVRVAVLNSKAGISAIVVLVALGCTPAQIAKSPADYARVRTVALQITGITHQALAVVIKALPVDADLRPWEDAVSALEAADTAIEKADDVVAEVCKQAPAVRTVAALVSCDECTQLTDTVTDLLCPAVGK